MKIIAVIAAALTVLLGVRVAFSLELFAAAAGCCLIVHRIRVTGWVCPRGAFP